MRQHHEWTTAGPQAVTLAVLGATIYGGKAIAWIIGKTKGGRR